MEEIIFYIQKVAVEVQSIYHVNPWLFIFLFFGSAIPLYYGYYLIGSSVIKFENGEIKRKKVDKKRLKSGIAVAVGAWCLPYIYVVLFGHLPLKVWIVFGIFVAVMGVFFIRTLSARVQKTKKEAKR